MRRARALWRDLEDLVVRPFRAEYDAEEELLGTVGSFRLRDHLVRRFDFVVKNNSDQRLVCTLYVPDREGNDTKCFRSEADEESSCKRDVREEASISNVALEEEDPLGLHLHDVQEGRAVVLYLHGNSGCRVDANEPAWHLLRAGIAVCCFDFAGCGSSEGDVVTLGWREIDDVHVVIRHLRNRARFGLVALWGRSMGAVTAIRYAGRDGSVAGLVLDSPYAHLPTLLTDVAMQSAPVLPKWAARSAVNALRKGLVQRTAFDLEKMDTVRAATNCFIPAVFGHGTEDTLVPFQDSKRVFDAYEGDKRLLLFQGGHNDRRPKQFLKQCIFFLTRVLGGGLKKPEELFWDNIGTRHTSQRDGNGTTLNRPLSLVRSAAASPILESDKTGDTNHVSASHPRDGGLTPSSQERSDEVRQERVRVDAEGIRSLDEDESDESDESTDGEAEESDSVSSHSST